MYKDLAQKQLFDNVNLGFEFEFFSPISRKDLAQKLTESLGKNVIWTDDYHSDIPVTQTDFKLEADFSGGFKMNELITGVMPYDEAIHVMYKVMNFIDEHGFTTDRTGLHINLSLNEFDLGLHERLQNLNVFKYILGLNEEKIFEMWPSAKSRVQKIYKNSVTNIYPKNKFLSETSISYSKPGSPLDFAYPHSKYFGMNFDKLSQGYLEIRYAGGEDYQSKRASATNLINYVVESLIQTLQTNYQYSAEDQKKVQEMMRKQKENLQSIRTYENFTKNFPDIKLYSDMKDDPRIVESNYLNLRESLFDLITFGKMKKGHVNYDSDTKRVQVNASTIKEGFSLHNLDFVNCTIESELTECMLYNCKVRSSHLTECKILTENDIRYSHLDDCFFEKGGSNRIDQSYIKSSDDCIIYANLNECIVRSGVIPLTSEVDRKTEIIPGKAKGSKSDKK